MKRPTRTVIRQRVRVVGRVTWRSISDGVLTHAPVTGADVAFLSMGGPSRNTVVRTDPQGRYVAWLPVGRYNMSVHRVGFERYSTVGSSDIVQVRRVKQVQRDVSLISRGAGEVVVRKQASGELQAWTEDSSAGFTGMGIGRFSLPMEFNLSRGTFTVFGRPRQRISIYRPNPDNARGPYLVDEAVCTLDVTEGTADFVRGQFRCILQASFNRPEGFGTAPYILSGLPATGSQSWSGVDASNAPLGITLAGYGLTGLPGYPEPFRRGVKHLDLLITLPDAYGLGLQLAQ